MSQSRIDNPGLKVLVDLDRMHSPRMVLRWEVRQKRAKRKRVGGQSDGHTRSVLYV